MPREDSQRLHGETRFAAAVALAYLVTVAAAALLHEPWRDEMEGWLIARDASGPLSLLHNLRYEGHPALWHVCLWPLTRLGGPGLAQALAVVIGAATAFVFARFAPFSRTARALFAFGYLQVWDWGAIARSYGLGVLLLLGAAALAVRRDRHPLMLGAALALAANTNVHAAIVAGGLLAALVLERCSSWRDQSREAAPGPFWGGAGLAAAGIVVCALVVAPPADSPWKAIWKHRPVRERLEMLLASPVHGLTFATWPPGLGSFEIVAIVVAAAITVALVAASSLVLARHRGAWVAAALPALALGGLFFFRYYGGPRHAGFLLVALLVALWVAPSFPLRRGAAPPSTGAPALARYLGALLVAAFAWQDLGAAVQGIREARGVYSAARGTAELVRARGLADLPLVADPDFSTAAVLAFLGKREAYYENVQRLGSFPVWDDRHALDRPTATRADDAAVFARARSLAQQTDVLVIVDRDAAQAAAHAQARLVGARRADLRPEESFWVYVVPASPASPRSAGSPGSAHLGQQ